MQSPAPSRGLVLKNKPATVIFSYQRFASSRSSSEQEDREMADAQVAFEGSCRSAMSCPAVRASEA